MIIRRYSELITLPTFKERFEYLKLGGKVGEETFGFDRYLNQVFYKSPEWRKVRDFVITRDNACDLGVTDRPIPNGVHILIHHMNPITIDDILNRHPALFDPENLISTCYNTHNAIHYGDASLLVDDHPIVRTPNDTCPWKNI